MVDWDKLQIEPTPRRIQRRTLVGNAIIYNHRTNNRYSINITDKYVFGDKNSYRKAEDNIMTKINNRITNEQTFAGFIKIGNTCYKGQQMIYKNI